MSVDTSTSYLYLSLMLLSCSAESYGRKLARTFRTYHHPDHPTWLLFLFSLLHAFLEFWYVVLLISKWYTSTAWGTYPIFDIFFSFLEPFLSTAILFLNLLYIAVLSRHHSIITSSYILVASINTNWTSCMFSFPTEPSCPDQLGEPFDAAGSSSPKDAATTD